MLRNAWMKAERKRSAGRLHPGEQMLTWSFSPPPSLPDSIAALGYGLAGLR